MHNKIAILGDKKAIRGFKLLGLEVFPIKKECVQEVLEKIKKAKDITLLFVLEDWFELLKEKLDGFNKIILVLPNEHGSKQIAIKNLKQMVERAVGVDLLK